MSDLIRQLLFLYAGIVLVNAVLSLLLWRKHRTALHRAVFVLWLGMMATFLAQGVLNGTDTRDIVGYSFTFIMCLSLAALFDQILGHQTRWRLHGVVMATCLGDG